MICRSIMERIMTGRRMDSVSIANSIAKHPEVDHHSERGATLYFFALMLVGMLGMSALVIDVGQLYTVKARLQGVADASALAAAAALPTTSTALTNATTYAGLNYPDAGTVVANADVVFGCWVSDAFTAQGGSCSAANVNVVRVTSRRAQANGNAVPLYLLPLFGSQTADVAATAMASYTGGPGGACVITLAPTGRGFETESDVVVNIPNCNVQVNSAQSSCGTPAVDLGAQSNIIVKKMYVVSPSGGCIKYATGATVTPAPVLASPALADPLAALPPPSNASSSGPCLGPSDGKYQNGTFTLSPGIYCRGVEFSTATINFQPGNYIIKGPLKVSNNSVVNGTGVMFYHTCTTSPCNNVGAAAVDFGIGTYNLSAPTTGTYKGILMYQDRTFKIDQQQYFEPNGLGTLDGALYFPRATVNLQKSPSSGTWKVQVIAYRVRMKGHVEFSMFPTVIPDELSGAKSVRLVQ
jgi:Flp pilus assembly protein TadG